MKKITTIITIAAMLFSLAAVAVSAQVADGEDPSPENVGVSAAVAGIGVSYVRQFADGEGVPFLAGSGVGAHGGHETRIVRTTNGTYATYITNATGKPDGEHPNWYNGVATFDVIKITASGFESIYRGVYPQAAGSCTPNIMFDGRRTVYVTVIADDKDRYAATAGTAGFTNGIWLEVIEIDIDTDLVSRHVGPALYDHTTTPFEDHGYGYSQPCLDVEHGKLYCITNGGEAQDPDNTYAHQAGYMAWWVYDLKTHEFDPVCHTVERFSRRCYMNVYPDGEGGFIMVTERCAPARELGAALGCTFSTNGYTWDALYVMHVPDPSVDFAEDTTVWEPEYVPGEKNYFASASHYGTGGCTYLDDRDRIHVIYSLTYYTTPTVKTTKTCAVYHAMYSLSGEELYNELIPPSLLAGNPGKNFKGPDGYAMTQGPDGVYYVFVLKSSGTGTTLEIWSGSDGVNFTKKAADIALTLPDGSAIKNGTKPIIANTRNGSVLDGVIPIMFHVSGGGGDPYYVFTVRVPGEYHRHVYTAAVIGPTCTGGGYTTYTCSCGACYVADETEPLGHDFGADGKEKTCSRCGAENPEYYPPAGFADVPADAYFGEPVDWAVARGITTGTDRTHFSPDDPCTRAQAVTFLWRAAGRPEPEGTNNPFLDVKDGEYYYKAVLWAVEKGITTGTDKTHFSPDDPCTRAQIVTFLWRAGGQPEPAGAGNPFLDVKDGDYFFGAVLWAVGKNVTTGTDRTHFSPGEVCTRAQIVTFLFRAK